MQRLARRNNNCDVTVAKTNPKHDRHHFTVTGILLMFLIVPYGFFYVQGFPFIKYKGDDVINTTLLCLSFISALIGAAFSFPFVYQFSNFIQENTSRNHHTKIQNFYTVTGWRIGS